jgi:hypothetical protein
MPTGWTHALGRPPARSRTLALALASAALAGGAAGMAGAAAVESVPPPAPAGARPGAEVLDLLKPGEWYEVPDSHLETVAASSKQFPWLSGSSGIAGIIACWAGGAFDTQRDQLYIGPGGGHNGYNGNEVYAFSLKEMAWRRLTDPYPVVAGESTDPTTSPSAIHTYDGVEYIPPPFDRYVVVGGWGSPDTYALDPDHADHWEAYPEHRTQRTGDISGWDPIRQLLWFDTPINSGTLSQWDPLTHVWTLRGRDTMDHMDYHTTGDIDARHGVFAAVGNGHVYAWQLSGIPGAITGGKVTTTGATEILERPSPGFCYDPLLDAFVAWGSGADVYTLDVAARAWTRHPPAATSTVVPGKPDQWGTFGRFRYVPSHNVFILCNSVSQNVFFYRLSGERPEVITAVTATATRPAIDSDVPVAGLIEVKAVYAGGKRVDVTSQATVVPLDPAIARCARQGGGEVTGLAGGTARFRVTYTDPLLKRGFSDTVAVQVTDRSADSTLAALSLSLPALTMAAGDRFQLAALGAYTRGAARFARPCTAAARWSSAAADRVTVVDGLVTAIAAGEAVTITATLEGRSVTAQVTVSAAPVLTRISFQVKAASPRAGWQGDNGQAWSAARGYGWLSTAGLSARDDRPGNGNALFTSFVGTPSAREARDFKVSLPAGWYQLRVAMGDAQYGADPFAGGVAVGAQQLLRYSGRGNEIATELVQVGADDLVLRVGGPLNYLVIAPAGTDLARHAGDGPDR